MSINLHCDTVELLQTPTWVTQICISNNDGGWQGILRRYKIWVRSLQNGVFDSKENTDDQIKFVAEHIDLLDKAVKKYGKLEFYEM